VFCAGGTSGNAAAKNNGTSIRDVKSLHTLID
jgi:hypothetical protein